MLAIYLDMGTTNTRAWLVNGDGVVARGHRPAGVRDSARERSKAHLYASLAELIEEMRTAASAKLASHYPTCIVASGMSSSPLGLTELRYAEAPAGVREIAALSRWVALPEVTDLPILLIPGVRSGPAVCGPNSIGEIDVMRGEETLCIGLNSLGLVEPPAVLLNLGSHWKAVQIDAQGRVASSLTTLSGELIHSIQTQTLLAASVTNERPDKVDQQWMERGFNEQRRSGLPRALFCVRLLHLAGGSTPTDRLAFMIGAFIAADLDLFIARGVLAYNTRALIAGNPALAGAWQTVLDANSIRAFVLAPDAVDRALLAGLRAILLESNQRSQ